MHRRILGATIAIVAAVLLGGGCTSESQLVSKQAPAEDGLAFSPAALLKSAPRLSSFTDSDRRKRGAEYEPGLANRVSITGNDVLFDPAWDSAGDALNMTAYALYRFELPGYADSPLLSLSWTTAPLDYAQVWIGLGNHPHDTWDWFALPEGDQLALPSLLPYLEAEQLLLAVLLTGTQPAQLALITVGDDSIPSAQLTLSPDTGGAPLDVSLSGATSSDADGSIVRYEWDFDGDGSFDLDSGTVAETQFTYATLGSFNPVLRVTDDKGATAVDAAALSVNNPDIEPPVADLVATPPSGAAPLDVTLDASGSTDDLGILNYDFDFDGDGSYEVLDSVDSSVAHAYAAGTYAATVRVEDMQGAIDTATVPVDSDGQTVAALTVTPDCGHEPRTLNAAASFEEGGQLVSFRWDYTADGIWDQTTSVPVLSGIDYPWGVQTSRVEVTDDDGDTALAEFYPVRATNWVAAYTAASTGAAVAVCQIGGLKSALFEGNNETALYWFTPGETVPVRSVSLGRNPPDTSQLRLTYLVDGGPVYYPVAIYYASDGDLVCSRAITASPADADDWVTHNIDSAGSSYSGDYGLSVLTSGVGVNARLRVLYYDESDGELYFAFSENSTPDAESDWTRHVVASSSATRTYGRSNAMIEIGGVPVIFFSQDTSNFEGESLLYRRATAYFPDTSAEWASGHLLLTFPDGDEARGISAAVLGGKPAASLSDRGRLVYIYADAADPSFGQWNVSTVVATGVGTYTGLAEIGSVPVIAYSSDLRFQMQARAAWAHSATPAGPADWCLDPPINPHGTDMQNAFIALTTFNGLPLVGLQTEEAASGTAARMIWGF